MATLKEIAKEANVSISTVSRVLSNSRSSAASREVKDRILAKARDLGYIPNINARRLRTGEATQTAPKSLYCLYARPADETSDDPFYSKLLEYIEYRALKENYIVKYIFSERALEEPEIIYHFSKNPPDYLIVLGRFGRPLYQKLKKSFRKILYIGLNELDSPCDQVICNGFDMVTACVDYLASLGHRNIAYLGANEGRCRGYKKAMADHGFEFSPEMCRNNTNLSMDGGYQQMKKLLESNTQATAAVCGNDMVAIGALRACKDCGVNVPKDMSLIGINDVENIQYTNPMLTSVHVPLEEMGDMGVGILVDKITTGRTSNVKVFFPFSIVKRESCYKAKPKK